jgi:tetratricopeptide (TPR) repeat protein
MAGRRFRLSFQHTKRLHFGLADRERAEKTRIHWPSGEVQDLPPLAAGFLYEVTEGSPEVRSKRLAPRTEVPEGAPFPTDNRARPHDSWLWEPVPLPERRRGPMLLALHAGESLPRLPVAVESLDLREAAGDLAAAYAILRRYLFDYRVDLETPQWFLVDAESRVRKVYAAAPDAATAQADLGSLAGPLPDRRGLPFEGFFTGHPRRDYYKIGGALLQAGYTEQALPYLEEMLRRTPDNVKALLAVGRIHLEAKRAAPARAALDRALALDPRLAEGWNEMGGVETLAGRLPEALRCYEKALALAPGLPYASINAAQTHEKLGDAAAAERLYRHLLEIDPRNGDAANGLGLLLAKQDKAEEARQLFELAISVRRDDASAINNLAVLYMNTGRSNEAIAAFRYGMQVAPDEDILYLNLSRTWIRMGERDKARDVMLELLGRKPGNPLALRALKELEVQ